MGISGVGIIRDSHLPFCTISQALQFVKTDNVKSTGPFIECRCWIFVLIAICDCGGFQVLESKSLQAERTLILWVVRSGMLRVGHVRRDRGREARTYQRWQNARCGRYALVEYQPGAESRTNKTATIVRQGAKIRPRIKGRVRGLPGDAHRGLTLDSPLLARRGYQGGMVVGE